MSEAVVTDRVDLGLTPYAVAQCFAVGDLSRADLIEALGHWRYLPYPVTDGYDWLADSDEGTWAEVERALHHDLIDEETYDAILDRRAELGR